MKSQTASFHLFLALKVKGQDQMPLKYSHFSEHHNT